MKERQISPQAQADHYRELARWTSDARTSQILNDMARELETSRAGRRPPRRRGLQPTLRVLG